jgi:small subunit ribosomal protein S27Ae
MPKIEKKKTSKKYELYKVTGNKVERINKFCPKCGVGVFMAKHPLRETCGKCGYMEMTGKKETKPVARK